MKYRQERETQMKQNGLRNLPVEGIFDTAKVVANLTIAIAEAERKKRGADHV